MVAEKVEYSDCITADNKPALCKPVQECSQVWNIISKTPSYKLNNTQKKYLRDLRCYNNKTSDGNARVCCFSCGQLPAKFSDKNSFQDRITDGVNVEFGNV